MPAADGDAPIVCTLGAGDVDARLDEWQRLLDGAARDAVPGGVRLTFASHVRLVDLARLVEAEHACCAFFAFAMTVDSDGVALEVTAPPEARDLVDRVFGAVS